MTEQPVDPMTEQEFLGNPAPSAMLHHTPPNAQRIAPPRLTPPAPIYPAPAVAMSRPYEVAQANVLLRKSITAAAKLSKARATAKQAEDALSAALAVESLAEIDSTEADRELLEFVREVADQ
ncbi:hypothetical protein [Arthrobacter sp. UYCu712]|uniref:hypothetical protein n=1 Tax=Arthrobacter sp. UYCu712 TaxID=3156340 RepID=UPI0033967E7F